MLEEQSLLVRRGYRAWLPSECGLAEAGPQEGIRADPCCSLLASLSASIFIPVMAWPPGRVWCLQSTAAGAVAKVEKWFVW